jgi:IS4 transposase
MKGLSRGNFEKTVAEHQADKYSKGLRCWDQLVAMIYAQVSASKSLREIEAGFNSQAAHHYHLGTRPIRRSTLSDANAKRHSEVFAQTCGQLMQQANRSIKAELGELLYLIDSTPIPLKGLGYDDWAKETRSDRTQGLKVHMMFASGAEVPVQAALSPANVNDIEIGRKMVIEPGRTYVFDKGYCDYNWWFNIHQKNAYFVSRFKKNAGIEQVRLLHIPASEQGYILEDSVVQFKNKHPGGKRINHYYGTPLRRIIVERCDKKTPIVLVTNDFNRSAHEIAEAYKKRWGIELFFKWLKQNLKIKKFLGRNENAVKIQIYTALIAYLLVYLYRGKHTQGQTLKMCLATLKAGLFQRPEIEQMVLARRQKLRCEHQRLQGALAL